MSAAVLEFTRVDRKEQAAKARLVEEALEVFRRMMTIHGCEWVNLCGKTPDGRHYSVCSGRITTFDPQGVNINHPS